MEFNLSKWSLTVLLLFVFQCCNPDHTLAQDTKGGYISEATSSNQIKGGETGTSSFRKSIESFKRNQQQFVNQPEQLISNTIEETSFSRSAANRRAPIDLGQQQVIVEQQEQQSGQSKSEPSAPYGGVAGTPGVDFPNYISIPNTRFSCDGLPFTPGMYADESTGCQVYHLCYQGRMESFLCGIGTVFNQAIMNCDFWHSVDCSKSSQYYSQNADFGKSLGEPAFVQQPVVSKTTSNSQVSSTIVLQPPPIQRTGIVSTKQQTIDSRTLVKRPSSIDSSSVFSSSRLSSGSGSIFEAQIGSPLDGKTSQRREEQSVRTSGGLLSPARQQQQLNRANLEDSLGQFTSESSTRFKVISGAEMHPSSNKGQSSVSVGSSLIVADGGALKLVGQDSPKKLTFVNSSGQTHPQLIEQTANDEGSAWKPYFKSKHHPKTATSSKFVSSIATTTLRPSEPSTVSRADREPLFSGQRGGALATTKQVMTTKSPTSISVGIEPDVGGAITVTETPSIPTYTPTFEPLSTTTSDGKQSGTPGKSEPPPPTEGPADEPAPVTTVSTTEIPTTRPSVSSTEQAASDTSRAPSEGEAQTMSSANSGEPLSTTTLAPPTTITTTLAKDNVSSVEYAERTSGPQSDEPGKDEGEPEARRKAAAKKRKAT